MTGDGRGEGQSGASPSIDLGPGTVREEPSSRFARSRDGKTIHLSTCHLAAAGVPWRWADDKSDHDVAWTILGTSWLRACKRCMGGMADAL